MASFNFVAQFSGLYIKLFDIDDYDGDCHGSRGCLPVKEVRICYVNVIYCPLHMWYNGIVRCVFLSPHSDRGSLVYVQNFNSPEFFLVLTKYVTMSCVGFDLLGQSY